MTTLAQLAPTNTTLAPPICQARIWHTAVNQWMPCGMDATHRVVVACTEGDSGTQTMCAEHVEVGCTTEPLCTEHHAVVSVVAVELIGGAA
jgi:hypothetical protein